MKFALLESAVSHWAEADRPQAGTREFFSRVPGLIVPVNVMDWGAALASGAASGSALPVV